MATLSLSIQTRLPKWELIGFCCATETTKYLFADPLGLPLNNYPHVRDRLSSADLGVTDYTSSSAKFKLKLVWTLLHLYSSLCIWRSFSYYSLH